MVKKEKTGKFPNSIIIIIINSTAVWWPRSVIFLKSKIFVSNFDTARPWPSSVKILALLGHGRAVSKFFFQILTLLGRGRAVSKFFFQILTLLGRGRAVSKF